jgi:aspartate carbamoyltransferase catalytic subunit
VGLSFTHLLSAKDLQVSDIECILDRAHIFHNGIQADKNAFLNIAKGKILATLFFEASTRTRMSFESAMLRLGGQVITLENGQSSSVKKGETLCDMGRMISGYADIAVVRHPQAGSVTEFSTHSTIPIINAGDGASEHPTQALVDVYTIRHFQNRLSGLTIGFVGDFKFGRTVNSLIQVLAKYPSQTFYFVSHPDLRLAPERVHALLSAGHQVIELDTLSSIIPHLDVLYMTRVQAERFSSEAEYNTIKHHTILTRDMLDQAKSTLSILHPLPRVFEITHEVDAHPAAVYFQQARFGVFVRMALLEVMV